MTKILEDVSTVTEMLNLVAVVKLKTSARGI